MFTISDIKTSEILMKLSTISRKYTQLEFANSFWVNLPKGLNVSTFFLVRHYISQQELTR